MLEISASSEDLDGALSILRAACTQLTCSEDSASSELDAPLIAITVRCDGTGA